MRRRLFHRDDRGAMAVEFALIAPVMLTLIMGVADFGLLMRDVSELNAAARSGLQAVLIDDEDTDGAEAAASVVAPQSTVAVTESCECADGTSVNCDTGTCSVGAIRRWVRVTVSRDVALMFPWPGVDDPYPAQGLAEARVE